MTLARSATRRRRRSESGVDVPRYVAEWFSGTYRATRADGVPWRVVTFPGHALLPDWWTAWREQYPDAIPPAGFEWLGDPGHPRQDRPAWLMAMVRGAPGTASS